MKQGDTTDLVSLQPLIGNVNPNSTTNGFQWNPIENAYQFFSGRNQDYSNVVRVENLSTLFNSLNLINGLSASSVNPFYWQAEIKLISRQYNTFFLLSFKPTGYGISEFVTSLMVDPLPPNLVFNQWYKIKSIWDTTALTQTTIITDMTEAPILNISNSMNTNYILSGLNNSIDILSAVYGSGINMVTLIRKLKIDLIDS